MTRLDSYWLSKKEWYTVKNGVLVPSEKAPKEALESYKRFEEQRKKAIKRGSL